MAKLEDIVVDSKILGLVPNQAVDIQSVRWRGSGVLDVTYKDQDGNYGGMLLYREDESRLELQSATLPWSFDADGEKLKLYSEANRIHLAHLFDPYLAVHTSSVEPLPHQISAVYEEMLPRLPLRYVLADDPGAGKTIMTGLLLKELIARGDLKRCMIVCPGSLAEQWQDELYDKFHLHFEILTNDRIEAAVSGNVFTEMNYCIARLDKLSRDEALQDKLRVTDWDLIVVDEAHKMSATVWGGEIKYTRRYQLGRLLSEIARHFLLLTAPPHNGKNEDVQLFLALVDADRFEGVTRSANQSINVSDVMRRLVKEELLKFDGKPLFPERLAYTVSYDLSPMETLLYNEVTDYVREEFNRADQLDGEHRTTVGFALTILQRRLASSPEAIYQSLYRRRQKLENRLAEERIGARANDIKSQIDFGSDFDEDDYTGDEIENAEDALNDQATAARTIAELEAEIATLKRLESIANSVRTSGTDRKWEELSALLQDNEKLFTSTGQREKLIIFTEHKDTLNYLAGKIRSLLGKDDVVVTIHGGMLRDERKKVEELFKYDKDVRILIATDAAGEGVNLQRAHLMVNYDLPWNPNRLEQRFGRIHRIGQTEVCHLWNLVANDTREGEVFQHLFRKLEEERNALGGKVFDILGKVTFNNRALRDLLIDAIRYGNDPQVRAKLEQAVDNSLDRDKLRELLEERALTDDSMDLSKVMKIREEMERAEAHRLQPFYISAFFMDAFRYLGGQIREREHGRWEILRVPYEIRNRDMLIGFGEPVLQRYERVCFEKKYCTVPGLPNAALLCPGHPLLEAVSDLIREKFYDVGKRGAILIDENDPGIEPRLLFYVEDTIRDGTVMKDGSRRIISQHVHFVELMSDGSARNAGFAPYLDYRPASEGEIGWIRPWIKTQQWLSGDIEEKAISYTVEKLIPRHVSEVRARNNARIDKTAKAVKERLTEEIQYWDYRASELKLKEAAGKSNSKLNSQNCSRRADELQQRLKQRMDTLEKERLITAAPPLITSGALVIPAGLLAQANGNSVAETPATWGTDDRKRIEMAGMNAVMAIERFLGNTPQDVSKENVGYDIESKTQEGHLRFIEVKGRVKGADTVTVSRNEVLTGLNKPESYILALVEVDEGKTKTTYLKMPFENPPDHSQTCSVFRIENLIRDSEVLWQD